MKMLPVVFRYQPVDVVDADGIAERQMAMVPLHRYGNICSRQFMVDETYPLVILEARSRATHNHFFAALHDGWNSLPETETRFPTAEHLRKWALVQGGFCVEKNFVCESPAHAKRLAVFIRSIDTYGVITIKGQVVRVFEAESQSAAAMGKDRFQASKKSVLGTIEGLLAVPAGTLDKEAGRAA